MASTWQADVQGIAADHLAPASALAERAARVLVRVASESPAELAHAARAIVRAQPSMAPVANAANVALRAQESLGAASVEPALAALARAVETDRRAAAAALVERVDRPRRAVTLSASAAVVAGLDALRRADLLVEVVCGESRPLLEGTALARWLVERGFPVTLACDAALGECIDGESLFLAGADALLPAGVVNKRGTRMLAVWAALAGASRFVLASRDKIWPPRLVPAFANPDRPATEIVQRPPEGLRVETRAFDVTSARTFTAVLVGGAPWPAAAGGDHALAAGLEALLLPG